MTPASAFIFLGTGAGSFGNPTVLDVSLPAQVGQLFAAKLNGDQTLDLVGIGSYDTGGQNPIYYTEIFTRLGNGDGTFGGGVDQIVTATASAFETAAIALGDFNQDGAIDVMSYRADLNAQGTFELWIGDGSGALAAGPSLPDPFMMHAYGGIAVGDFDGDGNADVAVLEELGVGILTGSPSGALNAAFYRSTNGELSGIAAGDLAGSGLPSVFYTAYPGAGAMLNLCK